MKYKPLTIIYILGIWLLLTPYWYSQTWAQSSNSRPNPPPGLPPNRSQPGGGLDDSLQSCSAPNNALTALVPAESPVLTTRAYPTFIFYIPDTPETINKGQFSIFTADEKTRIYTANFTVSNSPGILSISVPESVHQKLELGETYRWYFKIDCASVTQTSSQEFDLFVDGWVQRVTDATELQWQEEPEIWLDTMAQAAADVIVNPQNEQILSRWISLLQAGNLPEIHEVNRIEAFLLE